MMGGIKSAPSAPSKMGYEVELLAQLEEIGGNKAGAFTLRNIGAVGEVFEKKLALLTRPSSNEALLREALEQCADDLEAELKARWCFEPDGSCHPALQHKFDRDMVVVNDARKLIAKIDAVLNTVDEPPGTGGNSGSREPSPEGLGPAGFDPGRK